MSLTPRHFRGDRDVSRIEDFLRGRQYSDGLPDYWTTGKSTQGIYLTLFWSAPSDHLLWEDQRGEIQAYTSLSFEDRPRVGGERQMWRTLIHPDHRTETLVETTLLHAEGRLKASKQKKTDDTLKTVAYETDKLLTSTVQAHGYFRQDHLDVYMRRPLDREIPEPGVPDGCVIREFKGESEISQRAGAQSESFGGPSEPDEMSISDVRRTISLSEGREDSDFVAVSPSGQLRLTRPAR